MLFNIKTLLVVIAVIVIVTEAKPKASPQSFDVQEIIEIDELPTLDDDSPEIDADSFPFVHDLPPGVGGVDDYHIRK